MIEILFETREVLVLSFGLVHHCFLLLTKSGMKNFQFLFHPRMKRICDCLVFRISIWLRQKIQIYFDYNILKNVFYRRQNIQIYLDYNI